MNRDGLRKAINRLGIEVEKFRRPPIPWTIVLAIAPGADWVGACDDSVGAQPKPFESRVLSEISVKKTRRRRRLSRRLRCEWMAIRKPAAMLQTSAPAQVGDFLSSEARYGTLVELVKAHHPLWKVMVWCNAIGLIFISTVWNLFVNQFRQRIAGDNGYARCANQGEVYVCSIPFISFI